MATLYTREMFTPSTMMSFLAPCVMTDGEMQRPMWCAGMKSPPNVVIFPSTYTLIYSVNSDSLKETPQQKAYLVSSTQVILPWMTSTARGMRSIFRTVPMTVSMIGRAPVSSAIKLYINYHHDFASMQKYDRSSYRHQKKISFNPLNGQVALISSYV